MKVDVSTARGLERPQAVVQMLIPGNNRDAFVLTRTGQSSRQTREGGLAS